LPDENIVVDFHVS